MKLVVGLGNPGKEYDLTRHNVGFMVLDHYLGDVRWSLKFNGLYYQTNVGGEKIIFLKPQSYMNLSGGVVRKFVDYFDIDVNDVLIVHDDLDLPIGKIRVKFNSSAGGHNGIKDIISNLGSSSFGRLKIGISRNSSLDTKDYVLGRFSSSDVDAIFANRSAFKDIIENYSSSNVNKLMNLYN